ncbi:MAG: hypothetical protein HYY85_14865 [Deltaproteobacteria bacterium]|nr:hypothetical protein [Deltaproteobacteria bacterium]
MRRGTLNLAIGIALALLTGTAVAEPRGRITVAIDSDVQSLDPMAVSDRFTQAVLWHVFDSLLYRDPQKGTLLPGLARSWRAVNPTTWELKLHEGVRFHTGEPASAEAAKFSLERMAGPKVPRRYEVGSVARVEVVDPLTVRVVTKRADPILLESLVNVQIVPPRYLREVGEERFGRAPSGTGPYRVTEWVKGQRLILEANQDHWRGSKPVPAIKTVLLRPIPEKATQIAELLSGGVDMIINVPPDQIPVITASGRARVTTAATLRTSFLQLNVSRAGSPALQNPKVRQAINHAIDGDAIHKNLMGGLGHRTGSINPFQFGYDPAVRPYPYDPARARQLLREAGYAGGLELRLVSYSGTMVNPELAAQAIADYLTKVGIRVKHRHVEDLALLAKIWLGAQDVDLMYASWASRGIFDADAIMRPLFGSGERYAYVADPQIHKWLDEARFSMDAAARKAIYSRILRHIHDQAHWVPLYTSFVTYGVSNRIHYEAPTDENLRLFDVTWRERP